MGDIRPVIKNNEWQMTKHEFYAAYHYAMQYNEWKDKIVDIASIDTPDPEMADMPRGTNTSDATYQKAIKIAEYRDKMRTVEKSAQEAGEDIYKWLLSGVTNEGYTYNYLRMVMNMPCGKNYYYNKRRKFYYLLNQKIGMKDGAERDQKI